MEKGRFSSFFFPPFPSPSPPPYLGAAQDAALRAGRPSPSLSPPCLTGDGGTAANGQPPRPPFFLPGHSLRSESLCYEAITGIGTGSVASPSFFLSWRSIDRGSAWGWEGVARQAVSPFCFLTLIFFFSLSRRGRTVRRR